MKPCKSCPFRPDSQLGLWHPAHYIGIAYLGSSDVPGQQMGCHQSNGMVNPHATPEKAPACGGWVRAARHSVTVRLGVVFGGIDPNECFDGEAVMSPEEMCRENGVDVDRLPPLQYDPSRYSDPMVWTADIVALRNRLRDDPESAWEFVIPGSPLDIGVSDDQIRASLGCKTRYTDSKEIE